jgi:diguanylate cyclase (GGDEF)-like protein
VAYVDGKLQQYAAPPGRPKERIDSIAEDAQGRVWARTPTSLWQLDARDRRFMLVPTPVPLISSRGYVGVDNQGELLVSSDQALLHLAGQRWDVITSDDGLPSGSYPVIEDREGSLWIGADGLHRLLGRGVFQAFTTAQGLPYDISWSVLRDRAGRLWVGTSHGLGVLDGSRFRTIAGTEKYTIRSIVEGRNGILYLAGAPGNEVLSYDPASGAIRRNFLDKQNLAKRIFRLLMGRDGTLWASTDGAGLLRADTSAATLSFSQVELPGGSAQEFISDVRQDAQGRVWAAGAKGLAMLESGKWRRFTSKDGLRRDYMAYVSPLRNGDLLAPYFDPLGVARLRYENGTLKVVKHYDAESSNSANKVFLVGEDSLERLWIGGGQGIDLLGPTGSRHFGGSDGLVGEDTVSMSFLAEPNGDVWFGTTKGLIHFNQAAFGALPPQSPPATALMRIALGGQEYRPDAPLPRVPHNNLFEVKYTGLSFVGEGQMQYRERLLGRETTFNITDSRDARYSALPHGHYRFEVAARIGNRGAWGPTSVFTFRVMPAWWQTWWFRTLAALATMALLAFGYRWRLGTMRRENARLEALVRVRTEDLQVANNALQEASMMDPLTGLKNRRYLNAFMPEELARTLRQQPDARFPDRLSSPANIDLCLFMVDLDHFKAINDQYGHGAGDSVLRQVGEVMRAACRASDVVVRWGGEEFLIVARNTDRKQASVIAAQVCAAVRAHPFDVGHGVILSKTCSLGFTAFPLLPEAPNRFGWEQAIELADQCLYAAKKTGRDGWIGALLHFEGEAISGDAGSRVMPGYGTCRILSSWPAEKNVQW